MRQLWSLSGKGSGGCVVVGRLVVAGAGCGVEESAGSLGLSVVIVWGSVVGGGLSDWMRAGSCWRLCLYWSSASGGVGGAAGISGVHGSLSVVVRSTIGLMVEFVLVSGVLLLSIVVSRLSFMSAAVEAIVVMSESVSRSRGGGQWDGLCRVVARWDCVGCAVGWYVLGCP